MKTSVRDQFGAWFALLRLSNLPTVLSNVWTGLALGYFVLAVDGASPTVSGPEAIGSILSSAGWGVLTAASLFYAAGMVLNDIADHKVDQHERADRPLVAGRVNLNAARTITLLLFAAGILLASIYGQNTFTIALLLVGSIAAYNLIHKYTGVAVVFMGACRALLYPLGVAGFLAGADWPDPQMLTTWRVAWIWMVVVGVYMALVTWIARGEHGTGPGWRRWLSLPLIIVPLAGMPRASAVQPFSLLWVFITAMALVGWLGWCAFHVTRPEPDTPGTIQRWLAGLCLIDAYFLALIGLAPLALVPLGLFVLTRLLQRYIIGT